MEIRLLRSFLAIAEEGNITRAAESLHLTQPALSRQLSLLEAELGAPLFRREKREMVLTEEGILLRRRALEILQLVSLAEEEFKSGTLMEGSISIGVGELMAAETVLEIVSKFSESNPRVSFNFLTGIADQVTERLDRGLLDFGLLMEPVDITKYSFIRLHQKERWVAIVRPDDVLAEKQVIEPEDLVGRTLVLPIRDNVRNEIAQWFGPFFDKVDARFAANLGGIRAGFVKKNMGVVLSVEGATCYWDPSEYKSIALSPSIEGNGVLVWKKDVAHSSAVSAFVRYIGETL